MRKRRRAHAHGGSVMREVYVHLAAVGRKERWAVVSFLPPEPMGSGFSPATHTVLPRVLALARHALETRPSPVRRSPKTSTMKRLRSKRKGKKISYGRCKMLGHNASAPAAMVVLEASMLNEKQRVTTSRMKRRRGLSSTAHAQQTLGELEV